MAQSYGLLVLVVVASASLFFLDALYDISSPTGHVVGVGEHVVSTGGITIDVSDRDNTDIPQIMRISWNPVRDWNTCKVSVINPKTGASTEKLTSAECESVDFTLLEEHCEDAASCIVQAEGLYYGRPKAVSYQFFKKSTTQNVNVCSDSDGRDPLREGLVIGVNADGKDYDLVDFCIGDDKVYEWVCTADNLAVGALIDCPAGTTCKLSTGSGSKCVPDEEVQHTSDVVTNKLCSDSDSLDSTSINKDKKGTIQYNPNSAGVYQGTETDSCAANGRTLIEWYCSAGTADFKTIECDSCVDGKCVDDVKEEKDKSKTTSDYSCWDSEGNSADANTPGTVTKNYDDGTSAKYHDLCLTQTSIRERSCSVIDGVPTFEEKVMGCREGYICEADEHGRGRCIEGEVSDDTGSKGTTTGLQEGVDLRITQIKLLPVDDGEIIDSSDDFAVVESGKLYQIKVTVKNYGTSNTLTARVSSSPVVPYSLLYVDNKLSSGRVDIGTLAGLDSAESTDIVFSARSFTEETSLLIKIDTSFAYDEAEEGNNQEDFKVKIEEQTEDEGVVITDPTDETNSCTSSDTCEDGYCTTEFGASSGVCVSKQSILAAICSLDTVDCS